VVIDGTGASNQLITGSAEASCVVQVSPADLQALLTGQMNPKNAFLSGKLRIHGDMNLVLQLQKLFQT
jgi:putative sterol carrier protein